MKKNRIVTIEIRKLAVNLIIKNCVEEISDRALLTRTNVVPQKKVTKIRDKVQKRNSLLLISMLDIVYVSRATSLRCKVRCGFQSPIKELDMLLNDAYLTGYKIGIGICL